MPLWQLFLKVAGKSLASGVSVLTWLLLTGVICKVKLRLLCKSGTLKMLLQEKPNNSRILTRDCPNEWVDWKQHFQCFWSTTKLNKDDEACLYQRVQCPGEKAEAFKRTLYDLWEHRDEHTWDRKVVGFQDKELSHKLQLMSDLTLVVCASIQEIGIKQKWKPKCKKKVI